MNLIESLTPLAVAMTAAYGAVLVAKVTKVQKDVKTTTDKVDEVKRDIVTNHGSKNLGDAIDRLTTGMHEISAAQKAMGERIDFYHLPDTQASTIEKE
jgi:methylthioribose-1-phosphate isomerase